MADTLTERQRELLSYIKQRVRDDGIAPTFDEMRLHMGLASKSAIHRLMTSLEDRGHIRRGKPGARRMEVLS